MTIATQYSALCNNYCNCQTCQQINVFRIAQSVAGARTVAAADDRVMLKKRDCFHSDINHSQHLSVTFGSPLDGLQASIETVGYTELW
jgi:hypothetical protein